MTYLRVRAQEFKVALPLFMAKKKLEKGKGQSALKRQRSDVQHSRHRSYQTYVIQPSNITTTTAAVPVGAHNSPSVSALGKGRHKGKGKSIPKGNRTGTPSVNPVGLAGQATHKGKGGQSSFVKGNSIFSAKGKGDKGKGSRSHILTVPISRVCSVNSAIYTDISSRIVARNRPYKILLPISKLASSLLLGNS